MSLTNRQLEKHCRNIRGFRGVFSKDRLPQPRRPGFYILNLEDYNAGPGTHWVLLQVKPHSNWYFDSYGAPPPKEVRAYTSGPLYYSSGIVQGLFSANCGRFCTDVMTHLSKGESLNHVVSDFTASYRTNDTEVERAWKRLESAKRARHATDPLATSLIITMTSYCMRCKRQTADVGGRRVLDALGRPHIASKCASCRNNKSKMAKRGTGMRRAAAPARRRVAKKGRGFFDDIIGMFS